MLLLINVNGLDNATSVFSRLIGKSIQISFTILYLVQSAMMINMWSVNLPALIREDISFHSYKAGLFFSFIQHWEVL